MTLPVGLRRGDAVRNQVGAMSAAGVVAMLPCWSSRQRRRSTLVEDCVGRL